MGRRPTTVAVMELHVLGGGVAAGAVEVGPLAQQP